MATRAVSNQTAGGISTGGYNYGQLGSGPAGELATIMSQLLQLYETCMEAWAQMSANGSKVQALTANVSAEAQRGAAQAQSDATKCQAWQAGISGGIGVVQMGVEATQTLALQDQITSDQAELDQMNKLQSNLQDKTTGAGNNFEMTTRGSSSPSDDPAINARIQEMQAGRFQTRLTPVDDDEALSAAGTHERNQIRDQLDTQISNKNERINSLHSQMQRVTARLQQFQQIANGTNGGIAQGIQSTYQAEQGTEQAISTTGNIASQMAGTAQGTSASAMNKAQEEITSAIQQFRAAAQAYPQG